MARCLRDQGRRVALLVMVRPPAIGHADGPPQGPDDLLQQRWTLLARRFGLAGDEGLDEIHRRVRRDGWYDATVRPADLPRLQLAWAELAVALRDHHPAGYDDPVLLFQDRMDLPRTQRTWCRVLSDAHVTCVDYGVESPSAVIADAHLAATMREVLAA
jgi:thioesterase domain-containing protein